MTVDRPGEPSEPFEGTPSEAHPETAATADASAGHHGRSARTVPSRVEVADPDVRLPPLHCRDCPLWYGEEDRGWGPCSIKHQRGDMRFITFGAHACDEGYQPPVGLREGKGKGKAAGLSGVRSTSSASAVGYSSTSKQGKGKVRASRRRSAGSTSTRRRASSTK